MVSVDVKYKGEKLAEYIVYDGKFGDKYRFKIPKVDGLTRNDYHVWCREGLKDFHCSCMHNALYPEDLCSHCVAVMFYMKFKREGKWWMN